MRLYSMLSGRLLESLAGFKSVNFQSRDVLRAVAQAFGSSGQRREGAVVHRDNMTHTEQPNGKGSLPRPHGVKVSDGQAGKFRRVQLADQFHVAENASVSGVVDGQSAR